MAQCPSFLHLARQFQSGTVNSQRCPLLPWSGSHTLYSECTEGDNKKSRFSAASCDPQCITSVANSICGKSAQCFCDARTFLPFCAALGGTTKIGHPELKKRFP